MRGWIVLAFLTVLGCDDEPAPRARRVERSEPERLAGGLTWTAEPPFVYRRPENDLRSVEYAVRGYPDATLGVFHFGAEEGGGGSVDDNVERWVGQFEEPHDRRVEPREVGDLRMTIVDVSGTFVGRMGMGGPAAPREDWRLLGAIVQGPRGLVFFKLIGPDDAIAAAEDAFEALVESIHPA